METKKAKKEVYQLLKLIMDVFVPNLHPTQALLLVFIFRKTEGKGQPAIQISLNEFLQGVETTKPTLIRHLKSLIEKGLVTKYENIMPHSYSIGKDILKLHEFILEETNKQMGGQVVEPEQLSTIAIKEQILSKSRIRDNE